MSDSPALSPLSPSGKRLAAGIREAFLNPAVAVLMTLLLLGLCTHLLSSLRVITHAQRPYTIFYLVPVALSAAFLGVRGGLGAAFAALLLARIFLFNDAKHGLALFDSLPTLVENIEFVSLAIGTVTIAFVTGRLRETLGMLRTSHDNLTGANTRLERVNAQLVESEQQRRQFNRDVLLAVTGGKLRLIEPDEASPETEAAGEPGLIQRLSMPQDATALRHALQRLACQAGMDPERIADLSTSVTEAATNAIKHGNGGTARVWANTGGVLVEIQDQGTGIAPAQLARATLEAGYSTRVSLGMGFHMMLQTVDMLSLCTSDQGTTVLLKVSNHPRATDQASLLSRYASV